jgi:hypothetical protein
MPEHPMQRIQERACDDPRRAAASPVLLGWTDPETGEELAIAMHGAGDFLSELLAYGFTVLEPRPGAPSVDGTGAGDWMGTPRVGANLARGALGPLPEDDDAADR